MTDLRNWPVSTSTKERGSKGVGSTWHLLFTLFLLVVSLLAGCGPAPKLQPILATVPPGKISWIGDVPILTLSGSGYDLGYQHGTLLRERVRRSVANATAFVDREAGIPLLGRWLARSRLDRVWSKLAPYVPLEYLEEMRGLSDATGIPLKTLQRIHALPELLATTCSSFAAFGQATRDGRLIQIRNLDWAIQSNVQEYAAVFVVRPKGKRPFVSLGWLGFIGVISGVSAQGISVGEIGSETVDASLEGIPMPFLLRRILEESNNLEEAAKLVCHSPRTGGYNYLFADAIAKKAVALETTHQHCAVLWTDQEPQGPFGVYVPNAIFRADWALDPAVRDLQLASKGDPKKPGLESPVGSSAYDVRYAGQGQLLMQFQGQVDSEIAMAIARAIAPASNIQSIVYAYPELWFANATGRQPAATTPYRRLDLEDLLRS